MLTTLEPDGHPLLSAHLCVRVGDLGGPVGALPGTGDDRHDLAAVLGRDLEPAKVCVGLAAPLDEGGGARPRRTHRGGWRGRWRLSAAWSGVPLCLVACILHLEHGIV